MTTYTAKFNGREIGAIGKFQQFSIQVAAADIEGARLAIYETHEHISNLVVEENRLNALLNKRERKAQQLLAHYATCERLARYLGTEKPDGKKISVALLKIERDAHNAATAQCNGEAYNGQPFRQTWDETTGDELDDNPWEAFKRSIAERVALALGRTHLHQPPGFFVNGDARGYALKIDNENSAGKALIEAVKLQTDWGGYGILSPEINGN